jgi:multisubunit Na+/H+ antiporter MnhE subunit
MADQNPEPNRTRHQPDGPLAGEPRQREQRRTQGGGSQTPRRAARWLAWWVLMMSFWVAIDDSLQSDELLAGAGAAALAALAAEVVTYQAAVRLHVQPRWLLAAVRLPWEVARDAGLVYSALVRLLLRRQPPDSEFAELPVRYGDGTPRGETRRVLLTWARSLAPNMFVLGMDAERDVMVVHRLVSPDRRAR